MKVKIDDVTQGFLPDTVNLQLPDGAFNDCRNFRFRDAGIEKFKGQTAVFGSLSVTPMWSMSIGNGIAQYWLYGNEAVVYATDGTLHTNISSASYNADPNVGYTGGPFHGYAVINDGVLEPQTWDQDVVNKLIPLVNWPVGTTCKLIRPFNDFLFALRVTEGGIYNPRLLLWSDIAGVGQLPGSWDYTDPTNSAGRTELGAGDDYLVDLLGLRDSPIIYKQFETYIGDLIGGLDVFKFRRIFSETGLLSEDCVRAFGERHFVLTDSDVVLHDGVSIQSIADRRTRRWLFSNINQNRYQRCFVGQNYREREMWICFPESGHDWPNLALVWSWAVDRWSVRELGADMSRAAHGIVVGSEQTFDGLSGSFDSLTGSFDDLNFTPFQRRMVLFQGTARAAFQVEQGETFNGTVMTCYVTRDNIGLMRDMGRITRVRRLFPKVIGTAGDTLSIRVGARSSPDGSVTYSGPFTFTVGTDYKIDCRVSGRWITLQATYSGTNSIRIAGFDVEFDPDGFR